MKTFAASLIAVFVGAAFAADPPPMPQPVKEHEWLQKAFVGEWVGTGECFMEPGKPIKMEGTEICKALGGFWIQGEIKSKVMGADMTGVMTVGYDMTKKKFTGTWTCSMCPHLWVYEGELDSTGKILTLHAEGPNMSAPGKMAKYKDVTEFKSDTERVLTSYMQGEDGKWITVMTMTCKKK